MSAPEKSDLESEVIARAWSDPDYKVRLLTEPAAALTEMGVTVPEGVEVTVLADTPDRHHWVIPSKPEGEIAEEQLEAVAGGSLHELSGLFGNISGAGGG